MAHADPKASAQITLSSYVEKRLLNARMTSFVDDSGDSRLIVTEDGLARCSMSHTLLQTGASTWANFILRHSAVEDQLGYALVEFYRNSLAAGEPMMANAIICKKDLPVPYPFLHRIHWEHDAWLVFNERTGLLTPQWWHIYGCFPDKP